MDGRVTLLVLCITGTVRSSSIARVYPYHIGEGGGVVLTIQGEGFSEDQFNQFDDTLGNRVYLVNEIDSIECDVIRYFTNTRKITCTTRARKNTNAPRRYLVKVFVDGDPLQDEEYVEYAQWLSPQISGVVPRWSLPGETVRLEGRFNTDKYDQLVIENPQESSDYGGYALKSAYVGGVDCDIPYDKSREMYDISHVHIQCLVRSTSIGPMNASVFVENRGASIPWTSSLFVDSRDRLYQYHTYPAIRNVTPVSGGDGGGTLVTIEGLGFDPAPGVTKVSVGGATCEVVNVAFASVTCLTPPKTSTHPAPGERGALWEFWEGKEIGLRDDELWNSVTSSNSTYSEIIPDLKFDLFMKNTSAGRLSGYIHAPHDGEYDIEIKAPPGVRPTLYVAVDGNPDNKTLTRNYVHFSMVQETPAYFEIRVLGEGNGELKVAMSDFNTKWTSSDTQQALSEMQAVTLRLGYQNEVQQISFPNTSELIGSIILGEFASEPINIANPDEVKSGLLSLLEQQCEMTPSDVYFRMKSGFEDEEQLPDGISGAREEELEPHCGRYSWKLWPNYPKIYENEKKEEMIDLTKTPYVCLAILGNFQGEMRALYYKEDRGGSRISFEIRFDYWEHSRRQRVARSTPSSSWDYTCINLLEIMRQSSYSNTTSEGTPKLKRLFGPDSRTEHDYVYIDDVFFASEYVQVSKVRPSALSSRGISVQDVEVKTQSPKNKTNETISYDIEFTTNCQGGFPLMGVSSSGLAASYPRNLDTDQKANFTLQNSPITVQRMLAAPRSVLGNWSLQLQGANIEGKSLFLHLSYTNAGDSTYSSPRALPEFTSPQL
ncbi:fibrocystin-L-like [Macrobrachium nipponense]|uniref:fibrocystin-L-like n=1 Tax=Macrobrachium nipponense TaxID=159736 RepID=UPI0030C82BCA